ncbi:hypothetical protein [Candidatus Palauibacter sp.]|uniref:hypothetical protein n=1 Tax=Candidatus Palauibacter sp. TaxID=3101350 RepID=UPI003B51A00D
MEVPVEADLVADLHALGDVPRVCGVGEYLAPQEPLDPALFLERDLLGVPERRVRFVLDDASLRAVARLVQPSDRVGRGASPVDLLGYRLRRLIALGQCALQQLLALGREPRATTGHVGLERLKKDVEIEVRPRAECVGHPLHGVRERLLPGITTRLGERGAALLRQIHPEPQRPLDRHLPVPERLVGEDPALLRLLAVRGG